MTRKTTKYAIRYQWALLNINTRTKRAERHEDKAERLRMATNKYETQARYEFSKMFKKAARG
jgi:hypothetical protein